MLSQINTDASSNTASAYMKQTAGLNQDDFLKLFITQLQNQDPLNPQDSSQMVSQLAQFSQVEQSYATNTNLQNLLSAVTDSASQSAVSFIGKTATAKGSQLTLGAGSQPQLPFSLDSAAAKVQIAIQDGSGQTVRTLQLGSTAAGNGSVSWDGLADNGSPAPAGSYRFTVTGYNQDSSSFTGTPLIRGTVSGIALGSGTPVLTMDGGSVPLSDVISVGS